jgi:hypothetical protein
MIFISHRGNTNGRDNQKENNPDYVNEAIKKGYDVEIDVWFVNNGWFLGHDSPLYPVSISFLQNPKIWAHAKNIEAALNMRTNNNIHFFWHQKDDITITSNGIFWTYPKKQLTPNSICVFPEFGYDKTTEPLGFCSDVIDIIKDQYSK